MDYIQGSETDRKLYGQHYPHVIAPGLADENKIILFNNGNGRNPQFSEVFIINPATDSPGVYSYISDTAYGPAAPDYIYENSVTPTDFFSHILSSAQRLPNGNTLICEGINGRLFEITSSKAVVWEYINPASTNNGAIATQGDNPSSFPNTTFRGIKYGTDYAAFIGRDVTPGDPIELNPNVTECNSLGVSEFEKSTISLYPNPTKDKIKINSVRNIDKVKIYNVLGNKVHETKSSIIDLSEQTSGIYFLRIYYESIIISKKVIKN